MKVSKGSDPCGSAARQHCPKRHREKSNGRSKLNGEVNGRSPHRKHSQDQEAVRAAMSAVRAKTLGWKIISNPHASGPLNALR